MTLRTIRIIRAIIILYFKLNNNLQKDIKLSFLYISFYYLSSILFLLFIKRIIKFRWPSTLTWLRFTNKKSTVRCFFYWCLVSYGSLFFARQLHFGHLPLKCCCAACRRLSTLTRLRPTNKKSTVRCFFYWCLVSYGSLFFALANSTSGTCLLSVVAPPVVGYQH